MLVRYVCRNPECQEWPDEFINMMDKAKENYANILLLGDFNTDLFNLSLAI